jgi:hypothetical protein
MFRKRGGGTTDRPDGRMIEPDVKVRPGALGRPVLLVLVGSLLLLGICLVAMMIWTITSAPIAPREALNSPSNVRSSADINGGAVPPANPAYPVPAVPRVK